MLSIEDRMYAVLRGRQLRFLVVGGVAAILEMGTFYGLVRGGLDVVAANVLSFTVGMGSSFAGYRMWSFAGHHAMGLRAQFAAYGTIALINSALTSVLIHLFVSLGVRAWLAKALCMALAATWNFLLLNRIVFRRVDGHAALVPPEE